jgi:hypothetical protein
MISQGMLPKIFYKLATQSQQAASISEDTVAAFTQQRYIQESHIPDIINIIGIDAFIAIVSKFGGRAIYIPKINDVIKAGE